MQVYITKYALTQGILLAENALAHKNETIIAVTKRSHTEHYLKPDWHYNIKDALDQAELMRSRAIKSKQKKLTKLQNMEFIIKSFN